MATPRPRCNTGTARGTREIKNSLFFEKYLGSVGKLKKFFNPTLLSEHSGCLLY
jgi:hypothetical protein